MHISLGSHALSGLSSSQFAVFHKGTMLRNLELLRHQTKRNIKINR